MLIASGASKHYGSTVAVDRIDLDVPAGRIVGLVGNNGAGKTTTIKLVTGLLEPTSGTVRVAGADPTRPSTRAHIGYLPEESPLYDDMTPLQYLAFFARVYGIGRQDVRARMLLERLRLDEKFLQVPIGRLSKGSARKVAVARALLHDPGFVVLDEPTSGLDPATQRVLDDFLLDLRDEGKAILLSAHDLEQVHRLCDEVVVMQGGRIRRRGRPFDLGESRIQVTSPAPFDGSTRRGGGHTRTVLGWDEAMRIVDGLRSDGHRVEVTPIVDLA